MDANKILLAEDDNDMRRFLARALANAGYEVVSYDNGASAYERLREEPFTLFRTVAGATSNETHSYSSVALKPLRGARDNAYA